MAASGQRRLNRREVLRGAAALPVAGAAALAGCGVDESDGATVGRLEGMNALTDHPLESGRLEAILPAVRMNHAFFRAVRELELDDGTEPAIVFVARGPEVGS